MRALCKSHLLMICFILAIQTYLSFCEEDYYKILGVPKNADDPAIKKAFKKMSLKWHPDKNKENPDKAKDQFVKIANAYEVLIDSEKRKIYDQYGEEGIKKGMGQQQQQQQGNFDDIFKHFWGGQGGGGGGGGGFQFNFGGGFQQGGHHQQQEQHEDFWSNSDVLELTMGEIAKYYRRNEVWMILFYKSNEKDSKQYKDLWRELAEKLYGIVKVAAVNCIEEKEEAFCEDFTVYEVPKVLIVPANYRADPITYNGPMNFISLSSFAFNQMESFVLLVNDENYDSFVKEHFDKTVVLCFTQKKSTPALLKALSKDFKGKLVFGEIRETNKKLIQKFRITQFPTIMVLTDPEIFEGVRYDNEMKKDQIVKFLREYAYSPTNKLKRKTGTSGVLQKLTPDHLSKGICNENDNNFCLLLIVNAQDNNDEVQKTLENIASRHKEDPINFFYVLTQNINYSDTFEELGDFPKLLVLRSKRSKYVDYDGPLTDERMESFIEMTVSGTGNFKKMKSQLNLLQHTYSEDL